MLVSWLGSRHLRTVQYVGEHYWCLGYEKIGSEKRVFIQPQLFFLKDHLCDVPLAA